MSHTIPEAAVEAAAMAIYEANGFGESGYELDDYRPDARAAVSAAAPHLMAAAWLEGRNSDPDKFVANPYWAGKS